MVFKAAKLDMTATVVTLLVTGFIVGLGILFIAKVPYGWIWAIGMLLIPGISYALSPKQYVFDGARISIVKIIGKAITIPIQNIKGYTVLENLAKTKMTRTFGNGGLFGYYGMFATAEYGPINCQLTSMKQVVILNTENGLYALSPQNVQEFVRVLGTSSAPIQDKSTFTVPAIINPARASILILPIVLYVATIIFLFLTYSTLPEKIAVHFDAFGNPDRWGSKISYLISGFVPATILAALNCGVFFVMRKTVRNPTLPLFIVIIISFLQLFTLYINLDMFWLNQHNHHVLPFSISMSAFAITMIALLVVYYRIVKKSNR